MEFGMYNIGDETQCTQDLGLKKYLTSSLYTTAIPNLRYAFSFIIVVSKETFR